ncbi:MAG: glycosyltransferase family 4 protein [Candidatus Diapherotrites archaeon]
MRVLFFGTYDGKWAFNKTKIGGLRRNGVEVAEAHAEFWKFDRNRAENFTSAGKIAGHLLRYVPTAAKLAAKYFGAGKHDAVAVLYPGNLDMLLAWPLAKLRGKKIIYFPFLSAYDNLVFQRGYAGKKSLQAGLYFWLDKIPCMLADKIILDTNAHAEYFSRTFGIRKEKFARVFVGLDEEIFGKGGREEKCGGASGKGALQKQKNSAAFTVLFYGSLRPGQGVEAILRAAKLLEKEKGVQFTIAGSGPQEAELKSLAAELKLKNTEFTGWAEHARLPQMIAEADVCLGHFSRVEKIGRVIPTKAFEIMAMGRPLITCEGAGIREIGESGKNMLLVEPENARKLADSILALRKSPALGKKISEGARKTYNERFSTKAIGAEMERVISGVLKR